jgi:hypothetical protein
MATPHRSDCEHLGVADRRPRHQDTPESEVRGTVREVTPPAGEGGPPDRYDSSGEARFVDPLGMLTGL